MGPAFAETLVGQSPLPSFKLDAMNHLTRLAKIEKSLLGVILSVTQTPDKKGQRTRLATSIATAKVTGAATTAGIFGVVSTLGTAGTGTAIATLSGAASTSATLAWIGGLVGGGMAAGALVLPATGIAAGAAASMYLHKRHGRPRKLSELHPFEDKILFGASTLLRPLKDLSKDGAPQPSKDELRIYAHDGLLPLIRRIEYHFERTNSIPKENFAATGFAETITPKHLKRLRHHCRNLQKHADVLAKPKRKSILRIFGKWGAKSFTTPTKAHSKTTNTAHIASVVLAVTFQRLLENHITALRLESDLVLDALRRSTGRLENASVEELSSYIRSLSPEQLTGVASNTKGIYHELLFIQMHNTAGSNVSAQIMGATTHPGSDVQFLQGGEVIREVQLKAITSPTQVYEHLARYPDIEILVTQETAALLNGIDSSGFSNAVLSQDVSNRMAQLQGEGFIDELSDTLITSTFVTSSFALWTLFKSKGHTGYDFKAYLANAGIALGTATTMEAFFAWIGS